MIDQVLSVVFEWHTVQDTEHSSSLLFITRSRYDFRWLSTQMTNVNIYFLSPLKT